MSKILVTGGLGFIGSHLCEKLIEKGNSLVVIDNLSNCRESELIKKVSFYKRDICEDISDIFLKEKPLHVFHLAAIADISSSNNNPQKSFRTNVKGSLNVIEGFLKSKAKGKFIFTSSAAVYGETNSVSKESDECRPLNSYGEEKLKVEYYINQKGLDSVIFRPSNVYGKGQINGSAVKSFSENIKNNKKVLLNNKGEQTRDFVFVSDAVEALILGLKCKKSDIFNVSSTKETKIKDLLEKIEDILGKKSLIDFKEENKDQLKSCLDNSKIKELLGWNPTYSLEEGLRITLDTI